jgi:hypothetical protein
MRFYKSDRHYCRLGYRKAAWPSDLKVEALVACVEVVSG